MTEKNPEFTKIINEFYSRNEVDEKCKDDYLNNFSNKLGKFITQNALQNNQDVKQEVIKIIKEDYYYYSSEKIGNILKTFHKQLEESLSRSGKNIDVCHFSNILNKKTYTHNSSNEIISKYLEINDLDNSYYTQFTVLFDNLIKLNSNEVNIKKYQMYLDEVEKEKIRINKAFEGIEYLFFIDDYSGTGKTALDFLKLITKVLPNIKIVLFFIHITELAEKVILEYLNELNLESQLIFFQKSEKYFKEDISMEEKFENFEKKYITQNENYILGYKDTQSLITNYRNTPNNTLSLFWMEHTRGIGWRALFLRKQKNRKKVENPNWVYDSNKVRWYIRYIGIDDRDVDKIFALIYCNNNSKTKRDVDIELDQIFRYNNIIQGCIDSSLIKRTGNSFELCEKGIKLLEDYNLVNITLKKIISIYQSEGLQDTKVDFDIKF